MTAARDALADGRLTDAVAIQTAAVTADPDDPTAALFLFELLVLRGDLTAAEACLRAIRSDDPDWPAARRGFERLLRAEARRTPEVRRPRFLTDPPDHARYRWGATLAHRRADSGRATRRLDRADAATPEVRGFLDGREFIGLRDADDRFASVFEVFVGGRYVWVPFEQTRALVLYPAAGVLDTAFRSGELRLADGRTLAAVVPVRYPGSADEGDEYALAEAVDWTSADAGLVCGLGAKVFTVGEEELPLAECRMIEVR